MSLILKFIFRDIFLHCRIIPKFKWNLWLKSQKIYYWSKTNSTGM